LRLRGWLGLALALLALALWLAPALALRFVLPRLAASAGGEIEVTGARPALPFGVRATQLRVARDSRELRFDDLRAVLTFSGPRAEARVADGSLLLRGDDWLASRGFVRAQDIDLEALAAVLATPLALHGRADGVWRFGPDASLEGSVSRGSVALQRPAPFEVPFAQLVISAARDAAAGDWQVRWVDIQGPPLSGSASGVVRADGGLALLVEIRELEEPVRSLFGLLKLPTEPLPLSLSLEGSLAAPRLVPREATAPSAPR
jgi:hypothetical protein